MCAVTENLSTTKVDDVHDLCIVATMKNIAELIDSFGGPTAFGRVIGKGASTASEMKRRGAIPLKYWPSVIKKAARSGIEGVTADMLVKLHTRKR